MSPFRVFVLLCVDIFTEPVLFSEPGQNFDDLRGTILERTNQHALLVLEDGQRDVAERVELEELLHELNALSEDHEHSVWHEVWIQHDLREVDHEVQLPQTRFGRHSALLLQNHLSLTKSAG